MTNPAKGATTPDRSSNTTPDYLPDYLLDSTSRRNVKVGRRLGYGNGLIPRLLAATGHDLTWLILQNGRGPLYDKGFNVQARAHVREVIGKVPAWCVLQRGVEGGRHTNVILPADAVPPRRQLPRGAYMQDVTDLVGLTRYLSGPPDARTNYRLQDYRTGLHLPPADELRLAALAEHQEAKQRGRLPRMQWTQCLPLLKPDSAVLMDLPQAAD